MSTSSSGVLKRFVFLLRTHLPVNETRMGDEITHDHVPIEGHSIKGCICNRKDGGVALSSKYVSRDEFTVKKDRPMASFCGLCLQLKPTKAVPCLFISCYSPADVLVPYLHQLEEC